MAKKNAKSSKEKGKKKPVKKAAVKKVAKPVKKAAAKKPAKALAKKAPAPAAKKVSAKAVKAPVAKKAAPKIEKTVKSVPQPAPKVEKREPKVKAKVEDVAPDVVDLDLDAVDESGDEEIILTDAEGRRYCRVKDCDQLASVDGYCRYHYLAFWKKIQVRKKILSEGKLERYIEELTARYPDKFLDMLRKDLRSEKEFLAAIQELEIDESAVDNEFEDEAQTYIDEVRGIEPSAREDEDF